MNILRKFPTNKNKHEISLRGMVDPQHPALGGPVSEDMKRAIFRELKRRANRRVRKHGHDPV